MPTTATFNVAPPERVYDGEGDVYAPLRRLRARYVAEAAVSGDMFYARAAQAVAALIPEQA